MSLARRISGDWDPKAAEAAAETIAAARTLARMGVWGWSLPESGGAMELSGESSHSIMESSKHVHRLGSLGRYLHGIGAKAHLQSMRWPMTLTAWIETESMGVGPCVCVRLDRDPPSEGALSDHRQGAALASALLSISEASQPAPGSVPWSLETADEPHALRILAPSLAEALRLLGIRHAASRLDRDEAGAAEAWLASDAGDLHHPYAPMGVFTAPQPPTQPA